MDLINLLPHKKNTTVTVNVSTYQIDGDGICRGVNDIDAAKMLRNAEAWRQWDGKTVTGAKGPAPVAKIGLIGSTGEVIHKKNDAPKPVAAPPAPAPEPETKWGVPAAGEDWPDPTNDMPIDYLRQMADAYEVKHSAKVSKKDLIKKIMVEMYPKKK